MVENGRVEGGVWGGSISLAKYIDTQSVNAWHMEHQAQVAQAAFGIHISCMLILWWWYIFHISWRITQYFYIYSNQITSFILDIIKN